MLAVALGLERRAWEFAIEISAGDLENDNGMHTLLAKVDGVFLKGEKDRRYKACSHFDQITRDGSFSMEDYVIEPRYNGMKKYNMTFPDAVLEFKLFAAAYLNKKDRQLAPTACTELKF